MKKLFTVAIILLSSQLFASDMLFESTKWQAQFIENSYTGKYQSCILQNLANDTETYQLTCESSEEEIVCYADNSQINITVDQEQIYASLWGKTITNGEVVYLTNTDGGPDTSPGIIVHD